MNQHTRKNDMLKMPSYPGGKKAFQEFIAKNVIYPKEAQEAGIQGSVIVGYDITDNGIGIPEDDIPQIFQPFFSTKHDTSGIGLGLAIVHGIVKSHNGRIDVKSELGRGTTISITLPLIRI